MLKYISLRDSKESAVLFLRLFEVRVFDFVDNLIIDWLINCSRIILDYLFFILMKLELVLVGHGGIQWYSGVYSPVGQVVPCHGCEGCVELRLHCDANVPMVYFYMWCLKGLCVGIQ